jgi:hypothetical protein
VSIRRLCATLVTPVLLAVSLTACDPSSPKPTYSLGPSVPPGSSGTATALPDPCALVTAADLESAFGESFTSTGSAPDQSGRRVCSYTANETGHLVDVNVFGDSRVYQGLLAAARAVDGEATELTGIGDAAFRTHSQLYAQVGKLVIGIVLVSMPAGESTDSALESLGRTAAGRV